MGSRFVLLLDADVVPSRGLREGFLRALRGGAPPLWGHGGGLPSWPVSEGVNGVPNALDPPPQRGFGVLGEQQGINDLGVPKGLGVPSDALGGPKGFQDPGDPRALEVPSVLRDPNVLRDPSIPQDPSIPKDPNALEVPSILKDPNIPKDPNVLREPSILKDPNALEDPSIPQVPIIPQDPSAPSPTEPPWTRVLFVLPAFEVRLGTPIPGTKEELRHLWGTGDARPFYGALCPRCQAPTDYGRWWALPPAPHLRVAYEAPWRDPWEPFYVGPAHGVPPFDERFLQYGFNRISQACELHVAGFRFAVLDGAFVVHVGFKEASGFHGGRAAEQERNRILFRSFRSELRQRYPSSPRRC